MRPAPPPAAAIAEDAAIQSAMGRNAHLAAYLAEWHAEGAPMPEFVESVPRALKSERWVNVLYPVGDPVFVHVYDDASRRRVYHAIEPTLTAAEREKYFAIRENVLRHAPREPIPGDGDALRETLHRLFARSVRRGGGDRRGFLARFDARVPVTGDERARLLYHLERDIVDSGPLEPLVRDPHIEDVHAIGTGNLFVIHKIFDMVETNVHFQDEKLLDDYLRNMSERIGRPVSESTPIVDATLPDGSRINIVYSDDVSRKGPSFTIRKFSETPMSITQVCRFGTMSTRTAAYLWLCLEHGMSVFVCGETASGKTTTLNAMLPFVKPESKILSAEDTPEVRPPNPAWQQLVTRENGPEEGRVDMFALLKAALRSRPNYIIVGEIRGAEGNVAFQAMQTGHPVIATFHASSVAKMVQRLSSDPINVPLTFMDNLNVCLIQMAVYNKGKMLRRVLAVEEIETFDEQAGGVMTRRVFNWDPSKDAHQFRGRNNSHVLENKVARTAGYTDKRQIYEELELRTRILDGMIREGLFDYHEVNALLRAYRDRGASALPFAV